VTALQWLTASMEKGTGLTICFALVPGTIHFQEWEGPTVPASTCTTFNDTAAKQLATGA